MCRSGVARPPEPRRGDRNDVAKQDCEDLDRGCVPGVGGTACRQGGSEDRPLRNGTGCVVAYTPRGTAGTGQGRQGGAPSARASAPVDLTGMWVSIVTEDWRWRMVTPPKGDYASLPLTDAAIKVANSWDPARDAAAGEQCRPFGGAAIMRVPGRIRIGWNDDATLKLETEAGTQTRSFTFGPVQAGEPSWQGVSAATWQVAGGGVDVAAEGLRKAAHCEWSRRTCVPGICAGTVFPTAAMPVSRNTSTA